MRWLAPVLALATGAVLAAGSSFAAFPAVARADGDPASDVLATQSLFLPQDAGIPVPQENQLSGLLTSAASSGYPIRVAVIASASDLGSVTELWRQPQTYAEFLGQELSLAYRGPVLVVMPDGFGLYPGSGAAGTAAAGGRTTLDGVRIGAGAGSLGQAGLTAVQRLAAAAGHQLAIPAAAGPSGSSGSSDTIAIVVFALGALAIALAWAASLRARRPTLARRRTVGREP